MDHLSLAIGSWLRKERQKRGFNLPQLADRARLTHAAISHVETGKSYVTVWFLGKVCYALGLRLPDLVANGLLLSHIPDPETHFRKYVTSSVDALSFSDVCQFVSLPPQEQRHIAVDFYYRYLSKKQQIRPPSGCYDENYVFTENCLPSAEKYVRDMSSNLLCQLAGANAFLIPSDIGAFIYSMRRHRQQSLGEVTEKLNMSYQTLRRMEHNFSDRVKLADILALDVALELKGELVAFTWLVYSHRARLLALGEGEQFNKAVQLADRLVITSRLYQLCRRDDAHWASDLRDNLRGYPECAP
ncbi:MAG: XRE family transcriptional regulator [Anaerolineae bacterium]|nr:MAG: XRE family transcriptional regulator [Anaerolineae bacterium]